MEKRAKIKYQWLCNTDDQYSFGRVMPLICYGISVPIIILAILKGNIDNLFEMCVILSFMIAGTIIYIVEIIREIKKISVIIAGKKYSMKKK